MEAFHRALTSPYQGEFKLKRKWMPPVQSLDGHSKEEPAYMMAYTVPAGDSGEDRTIIGCITGKCKRPPISHGITKTCQISPISSGRNISKKMRQRLHEKQSVYKRNLSMSRATKCEIVRLTIDTRWALLMTVALSAIMQCADDISHTVEARRSNASSTDNITTTMDNIFEASQTILLCAAHQKR